MGFGTPQAQSQGNGGGGGGGERFEARSVTIVSGDEKTTGGGKVYWRVKDSAGKWYSVWDQAIKIRLETAAESSEAVPVAVKISPNPQGGNPFYNIVATDGAVESAIAEGGAKAQAASAPGGKNSEFGKRMHPDDALRVTRLALMGRALTMIDITKDDRPEGVTIEQFAKGKLVEYMTFMSSIIKAHTTPTPDAPAPKTEEVTAPASPETGGEAYTGDDDIPF